MLCIYNVTTGSWSHTGGTLGQEVFKEAVSATLRLPTMARLTLENITFGVNSLVSLLSRAPTPKHLDLMRVSVVQDEESIFMHHTDAITHIISISRVARFTMARRYRPIRVGKLTVLTTSTGPGFFTQAYHHVTSLCTHTTVEHYEKCRWQFSATSRDLRACDTYVSLSSRIVWNLYI